MYTHVDDYPNLFRMADMYTLPIRHILTDEERLQKGSQIAQLNSDIELEEAAKKQMAAEYKNRIDSMKAQTKLFSGQINHGFIMVDRPCEMFLDFEAKKRVYFDKQTGDFLKEEDFHAADFEKRQTALDLDEKLKNEDIARQQQIEANNQVGDFAEGTDLFAGERDVDDIFDPIDDVILKKKLGPEFGGDDISDLPE